MINTIFIAFFIVLNCIWEAHSFGVWDEFDLVRPRDNAWGSDLKTPYVKINGINGSGPVIEPNGLFGASVADIGDLNGDGWGDLAVGAPGELGLINGTLLPQAGGLYILFMHRPGAEDFQVREWVRISANVNGGPELLENAQFGYSCANLGDIDGDNITDIAVGAAGARLSATYILFMHRNGTVKNSTILGDAFHGFWYIQQSMHVATGYPPQGYFSRFGYMVAALGDWNKDGYRDIAIGANDDSGGFSRVYLCYLDNAGNILDYVTLSSGQNGAPNYDTFTNFGSSFVLLGDVDGDSVPDFAVGASTGASGEDALYGSGVVYVLLMNQNGTVKSWAENHALSQAAEGFPLPLREFDNCGTALTTTGDINRDTYRGKHPDVKRKPQPDGKFSYPIPDIIVGCPQGNAGTLPGRVFIYFMDRTGANQGYAELPNERDASDGTGPPLKAKDQFGGSLTTYLIDLDWNGLGEIVVGAPGDHDLGYNSGAIYVLFIRRRRYHPYRFDWRAYYCGIFIPIGVYCVLCWAGIKYFFWYYRRKPDEIEIMVKASDIEITKKRTTRQNKPKFDNKVHVDKYEP